jgi:hypothetical protein
VSLHAFAQRMLGRPFVLGQTNCSMLAAGAIDAMYATGFTDQFEQVALTDDTELEWCADRRTKAAIENAGFSRVPQHFEQPGDLLVGWKEPFERCGVFLGSGRVLTSSREKGVVIVPLNVFVRAYSPEVFRWV